MAIYPSITDSLVLVVFCHCKEVPKVINWKSWKVPSAHDFREFHSRLVLLLWASDVTVVHHGGSMSWKRSFHFMASRGQRGKRRKTTTSQECLSKDPTAFHKMPSPKGFLVILQIGDPAFNMWDFAGTVEFQTIYFHNQSCIPLQFCLEKQSKTKWHLSLRHHPTGNF